MTSQQSQRLSLLFSTGSLTTTNAGPYSSLRGTCQTLSQRGHELTILGTIAGGEELAPKEWRFATTVPFQRFGPPSWHFAPKLRGWLATAEPCFDAVNLQSVWLMMNVQVARWANQNGVPYMITAHGNFNDVALRYSTIKKRIARWCLLQSVFDRAACIQAANEAEYQAIRAYGINSPICVIPSGFTATPMQDGDAATDILPTESRGKSIILYLGRLHPIKNIEGLLDAWHRLHRQFPKWQLVIAGGGPESYKRSLQGHAQALGVADSTMFAGHLSDQMKIAWLNAASIFVLPSFSEGLPIAALEAMAAGKAVLLSRQCNLPEIEPWEAGKLTEPHPEKLASDMHDMLGLGTDKLRQMGGNARRIIETNYSWDGVCDQLEAVFSWMTGRGPSPTCLRMD